MRKFILILFLGSGFILLHLPVVQASEVDMLVEKLVEKKILGREEADVLLKEMRKEVEKEKAEAVQEVKDAITQGKTGIKLVALPEWVEKTKLSGDFRLRYETKEREGLRDRHRGRYRLRVGLETEIADKIKVAFGIASGSNDPRSTNQSFTNSFEHPDIRLDYAYAEYTPFKWAKLIGGKIKQPLWEPADLLWDTDIRPEGGAAQLNWQLHPHFNVFFTTGLFVLDERSDDTQDPIMFATQPGFNWKMSEKINLKTAAAFYGFNNIQKTTLDHSSETNTLEDGGLKYDYDAINIATELGIKNPFATPLPYAALFGEYLQNYDPAKDNEGFLMGWKLGHEKVKEKRQWQVSYMYRQMERDAWPDIFPDSDFYEGETNVRGHEGIIKYGLNKNVAFVLDYYHSENIRGKRHTENLLQVDMEFNF
jgi:hypothetical protein